MWLNTPEAVEHRYLIRDNPGSFRPYENYVSYLQQIETDHATSAYVKFAEAQLESTAEFNDIRRREFDQIVADTFHMHGLTWWKTVCRILDLPMESPKTLWGGIRSILSRNKIEYKPHANATAELGPMFRLGRGVTRPMIQWDGQLIGVDAFNIDVVSNFGHFNEVNFWPKQMAQKGIHLEADQGQIDLFLSKWSGELPLFQVGFYRIGSRQSKYDMSWMDRVRRIGLSRCSDSVVREITSTVRPKLDALKFEALETSQMPLFLRSPLCNAAWVLCLILDQRATFEDLKKCEKLRDLRVVIKRELDSHSDQRADILAAILQHLPANLLNLTIAYAADTTGSANAQLDQILSELVYNRSRSYELRIYRPYAIENFIAEVPFGVYIGDSNRFMV